MQNRDFPQQMNIGIQKSNIDEWNISWSLIDKLSKMIIFTECQTSELISKNELSKNYR